MRALAARRPAIAVVAVSILAACSALLIPACGAPQAGLGTGHRGPGPASLAGPSSGEKQTSGSDRRAASRHPAANTSGQQGGLGARLAAALAPVLRHHAGNLAVSIADPATGASATYRGRVLFDTASIVKADILAVLLLQHQQLGLALSGQDQRLAAAMIEDSDNQAASALWNAVEGAPGMDAGNAALGLRDTWPDAGGLWGLTTTSAADQLRLLADLTSPRSPLSAPARSYELSLMRHVEPGQRWGVAAAADAGTRFAVKDGWLPVGPLGTWIINSIGVIRHAGQPLLIAVLSSGQPSESSGIRQVQAAAIAATAAIG
jgi:Beta-lactamase enzyme family